jgi:hypothetical protein
VEEATFARRGFHATDSNVRDRLEKAGQTFLTGYHAALGSCELSALADQLSSLPSALRGFAFEGAGMSLALQDCLSISRGYPRFNAFLAGPGSPHAYMLHVGAGWAFARIPWLRRRILSAISRLDPLLTWLAVDGFGFHEGYFHPQHSVEIRRVPAGLNGYAGRAFDQGLGRSLWFVKGADPDRIRAAIARFEERRRADLWSGVGLACAYAGGASEEAVRRLIDLSGSGLPHFAQGVAFAAKARQRAGNPDSNTELTCQLVWGLSCIAAAGLTDEALVDLPTDGAEPAYEHWRQRIQSAVRRRDQRPLQEAMR